MKKSIQTWTVAIVALLLTLPSFGEGIRWNGHWKFTSSSRNLSIPIIGNVDEETKALTLDFQSDLGNVIVLIMDASGNVVYQESVQTDVTPSVNISLDGLDADGGTVSVTDGENLVYGIINL